MPVRRVAGFPTGVVSARHAEGGQSGHRTRENGIDQDRKNSGINPMLFTFTNNASDQRFHGSLTINRKLLQLTILAGLMVLLALLKMEWCSGVARRTTRRAYRRGYFYHGHYQY